MNSHEAKSPPISPQEVTGRHGTTDNNDDRVLASRSETPQPHERDRAREARQRLQDAIIAVGLPSYQGIALLAAAEMYGRELAASRRDYQGES